MFQQAAILTDVEGSIVFWNKAAESMYGWQRNEVLGKCILDITPTTDLTLDASGILSSIGRGELYDGLFRVRSKYGEEFSVQVSNFPIAVDGVIVGNLGISTSVEVPKTQDDRSYLLAFISENIPNVVLFRAETRLNGSIKLLYISKTALSVLGYEAQVLQQNPETVLANLSQNDKKDVISLINSHIRSVEILNTVLAYYDVDKNVRYLKVYAKPYFTLSDSVIWDGMCQNVTDEVLKDKRLKRMADASERFVSAVAHDLRSPLNTIKGLTTLLSANQSLTESDKVYIEGIGTSIKKAELIINDLLEIAVMEDDSFALETKPLCLCTSLSGLTEHYSLLAKHQQKEFLVQLPPASSVYIQAQEDKLLRLTDNVLSNAFKFTRKGDRITLKFTMHDGKAGITIADTGIGIPNTLLHLLFDRFTKAKREGLQGEKPIGLGMSIVKQIADLHQWEISIESDEHTGTVFKLHFVPVEGSIL